MVETKGQTKSLHGKPFPTASQFQGQSRFEARWWHPLLGLISMWNWKCGQQGNLNQLFEHELLCFDFDFEMHECGDDWRFCAFQDLPSWANFVWHKVHFPPLVLKITLHATVFITFVGVCSVNISFQWASEFKQGNSLVWSQNYYKVWLWAKAIAHKNVLRNLYCYWSEVSFPSFNWESNSSLKGVLWVHFTYSMQEIYGGFQRKIVW